MTTRALLAAVALAACGPPSSPFPTGADAATPDTIPPFKGDPDPGDVAVTVTRDGAPAAGLVAWFQDVDSSLVALVTTDEKGVAAAPASMGGFVTVVDASGDFGPSLATFAAIQPGDRLALELSPPTTAQSATLDLSFPSAGADVAYSVTTPCGATQTAGLTATVVLEDCGATTDVLLVALPAGGGAPVASLFAQGVPVDGSPHALGGTFDAAPDSSFSYDNLPATAQSVRTVVRMFTAGGTLFDMSTLVFPAPASKTAANTVRTPVATGLSELVLTDLQPMPGEVGEQVILDWGPSGSTYELDVGAALLPPFAGAPTFGARRVTWTEGLGPVAPDAVRARIQITRGTLSDAHHWQWAIIAPREATPSVKFPALPSPPPGTFDLGIGADDVVDVDTLETVSFPGGYGALRPRGFDSLRAPTSTAPGRIVNQVLVPPLL